MSKKKKETTPNHGEEVKKKLSPEEEKSLIFSKVNAFVYEQGYDEALDKKVAKKLLIDYKKYNPRFNHLLGTPKVYKLRYRNEYYLKMAYALGIVVVDEKMHKKPLIMARVTNDIVYERFGKGFVKELQARNPMNQNGERPLYHHQLLTDNAIDSLSNFIEDAIMVMGECVGSGRFRLIQCIRRKMGKSWQMDIYEDQ